MLYKLRITKSISINVDIPQISLPDSPNNVLSSLRISSGSLLVLLHIKLYFIETNITNKVEYLVKKLNHDIKWNCRRVFRAYIT